MESSLNSLYCSTIFTVPIPFHLQEKEQKYTLKLDEMRVRDAEAGRFSITKKFSFILFYTTGR